MSKSLGNFFTVREIFEKSEWSEEITGEILRYFLLSMHYHSPLEFSDQALKEAKNALNGFYDLFNRLNETSGSGGDGGSLKTAVERTRTSVIQAMDDDLNTSAAIAALQGLRSDVNKLLGVGLSTESRQTARQAFRSLGVMLGLFQIDRWDFNIRIVPKSAQLVLETFPPTVIVTKQMTEAEIDGKVAERIEAKKKRDFKRADDIRAELKSFGIALEDKPDGTTRWKR
jgi:cysteinyl-tRNA synthetase